MAEPFFKVVFAGELRPGADPAAVKAGLARLFKVELARIEPMFSGSPVVVRKQLDEIMAMQYVQALANVGAVARMEPMELAAEAAAGPGAPLTASPATSVREPQDADLAPAAHRPPPPAVARALESPPAAPDYGVAAVGAVLDESTAPPPADIAVDHLSMAAVGTLLIEPQDIPEPAYDLSAMVLAPLGTQLADAVDVPPAEFDLSALSLEPARPGGTPAKD